MSDKRTVESIHGEYTQACARAGHTSYQIFTLTKDLELIHQQLRDLNLEASKLQAEEKAAVESAKVEAAHE